MGAMKFKVPEDSLIKQEVLLPGDNFLPLNVKAAVPIDTGTSRVFHNGRFFRHSCIWNYGHDLLCGRKMTT
jgi:hypothetical protein